MSRSHSTTCTSLTPSFIPSPSGSRPSSVPGCPTTAKRANSSSAYQPSGAVRAMTARWAVAGVRERPQVLAGAPQAERALQAERRLADADRRAAARGSARRSSLTGGTARQKRGRPAGHQPGAGQRRDRAVRARRRGVAERLAPAPPPARGDRAQVGRARSPPPARARRARRRTRSKSPRRRGLGPGRQQAPAGGSASRGGERAAVAGAEQLGEAHARACAGRARGRRPCAAAAAGTPRGGTRHTCSVTSAGTGALTRPACQAGRAAGRGGAGSVASSVGTGSCSDWLSGLLLPDWLLHARRASEDEGEGGAAAERVMARACPATAAGRVPRGAVLSPAC